MKILHVMAGRCTGGAETYSTDVMLSLHKAGVAQTVVMDRDAPRYEELQKAGIDIDPTPLDAALRFSRKWRMKQLIRREQPDIVQTWMRRAASLLPSGLAMPTVGWFGGYYDPRHFSTCGTLVGVTPDIVAHMIKNGVYPANAFYIPTFPDVAPMPPADRTLLATPKDAKVFLTLSRLHPKKGLDTFLEALAELPGAYAWLAGDGPLRRQLEAQAKKRGVIDRVRFLGWRTDRAALLRAADVCVLPSRYEPFGTVILEAWAAGVPLVAARSAGPAAHVEDGLNGMLVPVDDVKALAGALRRVSSDVELRQRLVAQGFAAYIKGFTREAVTQQWLAFYKKLLAEKARA